jgi:hypothetical protein
VTAFLVSVKWDTFGLGEVFWTIVVLAAAVIIGLISIYSRTDIYFSLVIDWAFLGILFKRTAQASLWSIIPVTVMAGMALITILIIIQIFRGKVYSLH